MRGFFFFPDCIYAIEVGDGEVVLMKINYCDADSGRDLTCD